MKLTRRRFLEGAILATLGRVRINVPGGRSAPPREQHLVPRARIVVDDGVEVLVPPLHHRVVTARLKDAPTPEARRVLERALSDAEAGPVTVTVAWGLPYFHRFVPTQARRELPVDRRASTTRGKTIRVLEDAERFPSDPDDTILERNDVAVLLRADDLRALEDVLQRMLVDVRQLFAVTSIRTGFAGGGFAGGRSLPKRMATAARVRGAELVPPTTELFLGFTSTVKRSLGPPKIANFETLGYAHLPSGYFVGGTHMHLSHIRENLQAWYQNFDHRERVGAMFRPGLHVPAHRQTVSQSPADVETLADIHRDFVRFQRIGHAGAIQSASRLDRDVVAHDGTIYRKGTAVPQRADFNTLDNPFAWSADPSGDRIRDVPAAGVHFVVFNPTSDDFRRMRLAMDGVLPDGTRLDLKPRSIGQGVNSVLQTTHRQNFLVPPRGHRAFPLSELRA